MSRSSQVGKTLDEIHTPAFVVDINKFKNNCDRMISVAIKYDIKLRGQTKTHKTVEGGILQTDGTKKCLVVSTLNEAEMYAEHGFDDILYGYPLIQQHMNRNYELCKKLDNYHVMVCGPQAVETLLTHPPPPNKKWSVFLNIDTGYGREGIPWDGDECLEIAKDLANHSEKIDFQGIYVHCGLSYAANNVEGVEKVRNETIDLMTKVKDRLIKADIPVKEVGIGSTPTCSNPSEEMKFLTEIHPGNYTLYDIQQLKV